MTAAGQSALNIRGLDTVVVYDARYTNVVERGKNVLTRAYLGANEILQMAGRVHGRVQHGEVYILSDASSRSRISGRRLRSSNSPETRNVWRSHVRLSGQRHRARLARPLDRRAYRDSVNS